MRFAVFGSPLDPLSSHTIERIRAKGHEGAFEPLEAMGAGSSIVFDGSTWILDGEDLSRFDGYVLRRMPSPHRLPPLSIDDRLDLTEWWQASLLQQENATAARSVVVAVEEAGRPVINPWASCELFDYKPIQLAAFARAGLPIPSTCITNSSAAARRFANSNAAVIMKPLEGGAEARLLDPALVAEDQLFSSPTIFQEFLEGADIRVTVVGGRVVSSVEIPTHEIDYRRDPDYRRGHARYLHHALAPEVEGFCLRAAEVSRHLLSGVDLKRTRRGDYVLLEANSAPMYLDIELKTGDAITDAVVDLLEAMAEKRRDSPSR